MLTSIESIHMSNNHDRTIPNPIGRVLLMKHRQTKVGLRTICTIVVLSLGSLGQMETAAARSLDVAGGAQNGKLTTLIAQNPPTPPTPQPAAPPKPAPASSAPIPNLINNLNLPKTGNEVQITGRRSITLQEAIDIAFRNNRQIQAARLTVDRSRTGIDQARAAQALQLQLLGNLQNQGSPLIIGDPNPSGTNSASNVDGTLQATYSIFSAGRNESSVRAAEEQVQFDRLDLVRIEQLVRGQVLTAYYDLQAADSSVIINQAAVADATRSLTDAQLQERAGVGTRFDILTAQVQLATANQDLTNAQAQQQTARKRIAQILVVDNNTEFTATDPVRESGTWPYSLEDSVVLAFKNRPELRQQISLRRISEQQQIIAAAGDSAQVNLFGRYGVNKSISTSAPAQDNYSVGVQLSWSFLDGGASGAGVNNQRISQQIFENQFTTTRNQVRFEVEQAFSTLGSNQKNIATSTQALRQAEESLKLARLRFQAGVGTQTDVIQAQTQLARARGNRITAIINYNRSLSDLRTATLVLQ
ncbi:TolC family protein [Chamaesiphon polymorphus CCALA 037]|uniref:TolC family protein n=2 Tax=Chamaesiphon TaxID=217161 RepID=A0A2T1GDD5_9CYAN|nr:TolC family protein [Chamaesiphon polymorphus CCALA 037]